MTAAARTRRGERTAEEILEAARSVLLETGLEGFSLREVARRAGLEPSAIYNHFDGKDGLINMLGFEGVQQLGVYLAAVPTDDPAPVRLKAMAAAYLRYAAEQPERYRLVFDMLAIPLQSWDEYLRDAFPFVLIVRAVDDGLQAGELADPASVGAGGIAYALWALVHGIVMLDAHHLAGITGGLDPLKTAAVDTYVDGLVAATAGKEGTL